MNGDIDEDWLRFAVHQWKEREEGKEEEEKEEDEESYFDGVKECMKVEKQKIHETKSAENK